MLHRQLQGHPQCRRGICITTAAASRGAARGDLHVREHKPAARTAARHASAPRPATGSLVPMLALPPADVPFPVPARGHNKALTGGQFTLDQTGRCMQSLAAAPLTWAMLPHSACKTSQLAREPIRDLDCYTYGLSTGNPPAAGIATRSGGRRPQRPAAVPCRPRFEDALRWPLPPKAPPAALVPELMRLPSGHCSIPNAHLQKSAFAGHACSAQQLMDSRLCKFGFDD